LAGFLRFGIAVWIRTESWSGLQTRNVRCLAGFLRFGIAVWIRTESWSGLQTRNVRCLAGFLRFGIAVRIRIGSWLPRIGFADSGELLCNGGVFSVLCVRIEPNTVRIRGRGGFSGGSAPAR